ncbi:hypothetical protein [Roseateles sp.]|uniref:hypothetical protein n=1 Tax=Roseateles sp. TaxID=1971397 RepID=UPI0031DC474D
MTTPSTTPIPSKLPQDLLFNAEKADEFVNSTALTYVDRFGSTRKTLAGIKADTLQQTQAFFASLGYLPPVAYASGLSMTQPNQTVSYSGSVYAPKLDQLPFTTSGTFEAAKFRLIQGLTAADLGAPSGGTLVGNSPSNTTGLGGQVNQIVTPYLYASLQACVTANPGRTILIPSGEWVGDVNVGNSVRLLGEKRPTFNHTTKKYEGGTVIKGVVNCTGAFGGFAMENIGVDAQGHASHEVGVFVGSGGLPLKGLRIFNCSFAGDPSSNHALLAELCEDVHLNEIECIGSNQGVAVKAVSGFIGRVTGIDTVTWTLTVRYSPGIPCSDLLIGEVQAYTKNAAKVGGVICMNDQPDVAMSNIDIARISIKNGLNGFYVSNTGNTMGAQNVRLREAYIQGVGDFAIQTFGPVKGFKANNIHLKDCAGSFFSNNDANAEDFELYNFCMENTTGYAVLSGKNHKVRGWTRKGAAGVVLFIQNRSTDLQLWDMDLRVNPVVNDSGGTVLQNLYPVIPIFANGNMPSMVAKPVNIVTKSLGGVAQNQAIPIYSLPVGSQIYILELMVAMFSVAGRHMRKVVIAGNDIQYAASSAFAANVFSVQRTGDAIEVKYLHSVAGSVDIDAVIAAFHEA